MPGIRKSFVFRKQIFTLFQYNWNLSLLFQTFSNQFDQKFRSTQYIYRYT